MNPSFHLSADHVNGPDLLVCRPLEERGVPHGFSLRLRHYRSTDSPQPYGLPENADRDVEEVAIRLGSKHPIRMNQVHGAKLVVSSEPSAEAPICDGLFTRSDRLALVVRTADCVPLLMWDAEHNVVAAVHAGWRGTLERITTKAIELFQYRFSSHPESIYVSMGPAIGPCCYEVGDEVVQAYARRFRSAEKYFSTGPRGTRHLDVIEANRHQLVDSGISPDRIFSTGLCTSCDNSLAYSYRKEGKGTGRLYGAISVARGE